MAIQKSYRHKQLIINDRIFSKKSLQIQFHPIERFLDMGLVQFTPGS